MSGEFYIGYQRLAPPGLARFVRVRAALLLTALPLLAALTAWQQRPADAGRFEFGTLRAFEGVLAAEPLPLLYLDGPAGAQRALPVVGFGKHGLPPFAEAGLGRRVAFRGTLVQRQGMAMAEMNAPDTFKVLGPPAAPPPAAVSLGKATLEGELVDTKCFLGVMRPGAGKVHRACAAVCLAGGVPPGVLVRDAAGGDLAVLLAGADGAKLALDPQWAARRVRAAGTLELHAGTPVLRTRTLSLAD